MSLDTQFLAFSCALLQSYQDEFRTFCMAIIGDDVDSVPQLLSAFVSSEDFESLWRSLGIKFDVLDDEAEFEVRTSPREPNVPVYGMVFKMVSDSRCFAIFVGRNVVINTSCIESLRMQYVDLRRDAALFYHRVTNPPFPRDNNDVDDF